MSSGFVDTGGTDGSLTLTMGGGGGSGIFTASVPAINVDLSQKSHNTVPLCVLSVCLSGLGEAV
jgi:hypothetical protein